MIYTSWRQLSIKALLSEKTRWTHWKNHLRASTWSFLIKTYWGARDETIYLLEQPEVKKVLLYLSGFNGRHVHGNYKRKKSNNNLGCSIFHTHANLPSVCTRYFVRLWLRTLVFTTNYTILALNEIFHNRLIRN